MQVSIIEALAAKTTYFIPYFSKICKRLGKSCPSLLGNCYYFTDTLYIFCKKYGRCNTVLICVVYTVNIQTDEGNLCYS